MAKRDQAGFTLIELMLVMAIGAMLAVLAFAGQRGLRAQAQFDADVNGIVSSIADAHNEATAAVNLTGSGDGSKDCLSNPVGSNNYEFAGVAWTGLDAPGGAAFNMTFYAANRKTGPAACAFDVRAINVASNIRVNIAPPGTGIAKLLFVRNDTGGLTICSVPAAATNVLPVFANGFCNPASAPNITTVTLNLSDADGHTSQVQVDTSGLAKRIN